MRFLGFIQNGVQRWGKVARLNGVTFSSRYMGSTSTFPGFMVTLEIQAASSITFTGLATFLVDSQAVVVRLASVTVSSDDMAFTDAFPGLRIAALIVDRTQGITGTG